MKLQSFKHYSDQLETVAHDAWITARVKSALALGEPTLGLQIHVKTFAGTVALSGRVNTHKQCEQAVALARTVPGVVEIDARELLTHVFTPGSVPTPPNAEENMESRAQSSEKPDDK
ncbi:BON domain-containing protein [Pseudomonas sp. TH41]|jgi:hyperosmotically inducible protein|uniref:BON domain-containing protein n=1 Tax=Pseudomonas sp. TH41 TaxID=2796405 RepID=UPI001912F051|nr:BON domain-containing protein [Pseudomonas sp. TH41]MBK5354190.1 BON domain-containing protein [Pseudomonas sp. TH41]